jgi:hypothetical protein
LFSGPKGEVSNLKASFKKRADKIIYLDSHEIVPDGRLKKFSSSTHFFPGHFFSGNLFSGHLFPRQFFPGIGVHRAFFFDYIALSRKISTY